MRAARNFARMLHEDGLLPNVSKIQCELWGSLGATGIGHLTPDAIIAGLQGFKPNNYDKSKLALSWRDLPVDGTTRQIALYGLSSIEISRHDITFSPRKIHAKHSNCLVLSALNSDGALIRETVYLSTGGGAVLIECGDKYVELGVVHDKSDTFTILPPQETSAQDKSDYNNATELLEVCGRLNSTIAEIARRQEKIHYGDQFSDEMLNEQLDYTWSVMNQCIDKGLEYDGQIDEMICPQLGLRKRAPSMLAHYQKLRSAGRSTRTELLSCFALAVNEQNAVGERIVTAPTAGSAGVVPAVLRYYIFQETETGWTNEGKKQDDIRAFLLTAAVIGTIIKQNGSISGAECGCQAEIGSACAMAAAGLTAVLGGEPKQVENAAEIALEYHLGLTCDPVGGLVFIPCIERNAMAANTAVTAAELALGGDGSHKVSLDAAIETMRQTGMDMNEAYKETSKAGLATNVSC
jgi:L-serine dehydratase